MINCINEHSIFSTRKGLDRSDNQWQTSDDFRFWWSADHSDTPLQDAHARALMLDWHHLSPSDWTDIVPSGRGRVDALYRWRWLRAPAIQTLSRTSTLVKEDAGDRPHPGGPMREPDRNQGQNSQGCYCYFLFIRIQTRPAALNWPSINFIYQLTCTCLLTWVLVFSSDLFCLQDFDLC